MDYSLTKKVTISNQLIKYTDLDRLFTILFFCLGSVFAQNKADIQASIDSILNRNLESFYSGKPIDYNDLQKLNNTYIVGGFLDSLGKINYAKNAFLEIHHLFSIGESRIALKTAQKILETASYKDIHKYIYLFLFEYHLTIGEINKAALYQKQLAIQKDAFLLQYVKHLTDLHKKLVYDKDRVAFKTDTVALRSNPSSRFYGLSALHPFLQQNFVIEGDSLIIHVPKYKSVNQNLGPPVLQTMWLYHVSQSDSDTAFGQMIAKKSPSTLFVSDNLLTLKNQFHYFTINTLNESSHDSEKELSLFSFQLMKNGFCDHLVNNGELETTDVSESENRYYPYFAILLLVFLFTFVFYLLLRFKKIQPFLISISGFENSVEEKISQETIDLQPWRIKLLILHPNLKEQDIELAQLVKEGKTSKEIASERKMSIRGAEAARARLKNKLNLTSNETLFHHLNSL